MKKFIKILLSIACSFLFLNFAYALSLKPNPPARYTVKSGDSLWQIASIYLQNPWEWKQLYRTNPKIKNPDLIYPGDVLVLTKVSGRVVLEKVASSSAPRDLHAQPIALMRQDIPPLVREPIPTIPYKQLKPFLRSVQVVSNREYDGSPYIVGIPDLFNLATTDDKVYVRRLHGPLGASYAIFREGQPFLDPQTEEILGFRAVLAGYGTLIRPGDPATLRITEVKEEIQVGDRIMSDSTNLNNMHFSLKAPRVRVSGQIISDLDDKYLVAPYQIVAINRGTANGIVPGDVLAIYHPGDNVPDRMLPKEHHMHPQMVKLPDERVGDMVVFRTFKRVSFALVTYGTREAEMLDNVANP